MTGKRIVVTGGSRGIGKSIALQLARDGATVVITYRQEKAKAEAVVEEITQGGGVCYCVSGDLSQPEEAEAAMKTSLTLLKGIDAVVCNAGRSYMGLLQDMTSAQWQSVMDTNLNSLFYTIKPLLPSFLQEKSGSIVTVSSMWGQVGASCEVAYSASKSGVIGFTKALAQELGPSGIRVNCVAPGVIETDMIGMLREEDKICLKEETPLGRIGTGEEVAEVVAFLISEKARFLTGQVVAPNGGLVM